MYELLTTLFRKIQPAGVYCKSGSFSANMISSLAPSESNSLYKYSHRQLIEFSTGRYLAKEVCKEIGVVAPEVLKHKDGYAIWPRGVVGSISHTNIDNIPHTLVAAANEQHFVSIGVDVEYAAKSFASDIIFWLNKSELAWLNQFTEPSKSNFTTCLWASKEAIAKSIFCPKGWLERIHLKPSIVGGIVTSEGYLDGKLCEGLIVKSLCAGPWVIALAWIKKIH